MLSCTALYWRAIHRTRRRARAYIESPCEARMALLREAVRLTNFLAP